MRKLNIIYRVDVSESIRAIERGESVEFDVAEFAAVPTVRCACMKINRERGENSLSVHSTARGTSGYIERSW